MNRVYIAIVALCLLPLHLLGQTVGLGNGGVNLFDSPPAFARTLLSESNLGFRENLGGGVCFPPPSYSYCNYDYTYSNMDLYRLWVLYRFWGSLQQREPPRPIYIDRSPEPPPPPAPPARPVLHEYSWPEEVNTPATFSIVTTGGEVYLARMVWVEGDDLHFNPVNGVVRQIPLSSVSRSLTQTANAQKNLNLPLPPTDVEVSPSNSQDPIPTTSKASEFLGKCN